MLVELENVFLIGDIYFTIGGIFFTIGGIFFKLGAKNYFGIEKTSYFGNGPLYPSCIRYPQVNFAENPQLKIFSFRSYIIICNS